MASSEILHPALRALPDVILAIDPGALQIIDVNHAEAFGYAREALASFALDALLDLPREELARFLVAADASSIDVGIRLEDGAVVHATARAASSGGTTSAPCVLLVIREVPELARVLAQIDRVRGVLDGASETLARLSELQRTAGPPASRDVDVPTPRGRLSVPELSVAQYASLCVEADGSPDNLAAVDARYGLRDEAARAELHRIWNDKLAADGALKEQWVSLAGQYREYLQAQQRARPEGSAPGVSDPAEALRQQRATAPSAPARPITLPFARSEAPPPASAQPRESAPDLNARGTLGIATAIRAVDPLPFRSAEALDLSLEQFTAVAVELEGYPERRAEILAKHGIASEAAWRACDDHWAARFVADAGLRQRWMQLASELRAKLHRR
jgi:hypothetical protein